MKVSVNLKSKASGLTVKSSVVDAVSVYSQFVTDTAHTLAEDYSYNSVREQNEFYVEVCVAGEVKRKIEF